MNGKNFSDLRQGAYADHTWADQHLRAETVLLNREGKEIIVYDPVRGMVWGRPIVSFLYDLATDTIIAHHLGVGHPSVETLGDLIRRAGLISLEAAAAKCGLRPKALRRLITAGVPLPKGQRSQRESTMFSLEEVLIWERTRRRLIDIHAARKLLGLPGYAVLRLEQIGRVRREIGPAAIMRGVPRQSDLWLDSDSILRLQRELEESSRPATDADRTISSLLAHDLRPGRWLDALELVLRDRAFGMVPGNGAVFDRVVLNPDDLAAASAGRLAVVSQAEGTLSTRDAAEYLRTSERKVCLLMTAGAIEHVSGGRNRRRPLILSLCRFAQNHVLSEEVDVTGLPRKGLTRVLDRPRAWLRPRAFANGG